MPADRHELLEQRTRYDPADVESRVFERWEEAGIFHPEPEGNGGRELLDRGAAAQRHRGAAHGPRAERLDPGHADPASRACRASAPSGSSAPTTPGIATQAQVEKALDGGGHDQGGARPRRVRRARLGVARASTARRSSSQFKRARGVARLRRRALHDGRRLRSARSPRCSSRLYEKGLDLPRQLHGQLGPGHRARRSPTSRSSSARSRTRSTTIDYPLGVRLGVDDGRDDAPRDDAGRHRGRGEPERRALQAPDRQDRDPAARRPARCR